MTATDKIRIDTGAGMIDTTIAKLTTGFLINIFTPFTKKVWAVGEVLETAFFSLPDISTKTPVD